MHEISGLLTQEPNLLGPLLMTFPEFPLFPSSKANLLPQSVQCAAWLFITVSLTSGATQRLLYEEVISEGEQIKISILASRLLFHFTLPEFSRSD
jgi:hypothetical protein